MKTRSATPPTRAEQDLLDRLSALSGVRVRWIRLTETTLTKATPDANLLLREAFAATGFHDYEGQDVGPEHKASPDVSVLGPNGIVKSRLSLYRPATKGGAFRRIWIEGFKEILPEAEPGDLIAFAQDGTTCLAVDVTDASRGEVPLDEAFQVFVRVRKIPGAAVAASGQDLVGDSIGRIRRRPGNAVRRAGRAAGVPGEGECWSAALLI